MSAPDTDPFYDALRNRLHDYEEPLPAGGWAGIAPQLPSAAPRPPRWRRPAAAAAVLLLLLLPLATLLWWQRRPTAQLAQQSGPAASSQAGRSAATPGRPGSAPAAAADQPATASDHAAGAPAAPSTPLAAARPAKAPALQSADAAAPHLGRPGAHARRAHLAAAATRRRPRPVAPAAPETWAAVPDKAPASRAGATHAAPATGRQRRRALPGGLPMPIPGSSVRTAVVAGELAPASAPTASPATLPAASGMARPEAGTTGTSAPGSSASVVAGGQATAAAPAAVGTTPAPASGAAPETAGSSAVGGSAPVAAATAPHPLFPASSTAVSDSDQLPASSLEAAAGVPGLPASGELAGLQALLPFLQLPAGAALPTPLPAPPGPRDSLRLRPARLSLGLLLGASLERRGAGSVPAHLQQLEQAGPGASVELAARYRLSPALGLRSGVGYAEQRQQLALTVEKRRMYWARTTQAIVRTNAGRTDTVWVVGYAQRDSVLSRQRQQFRLSQRYLTLPLVAEWRPRIPFRWQPVLGLGATTSWLLSGSYLAATNGCNCQEQTQRGRGAGPLAPVSVALTAGLGLDYALSVRSTLLLRPTATYWLSSTARSGPRRPVSVGLQVGLLFDSHRP